MSVSKFSALGVSFVFVNLLVYIKRTEERKSRDARIQRFLRGFVRGDMSHEEATKGIHDEDDHEEQDDYVDPLMARRNERYREQTREWEDSLARGSPWAYEDEERSNWLERWMADKTVRAQMIREASVLKVHKQVAESSKWRSNMLQNTG